MGTVSGRRKLALVWFAVDAVIALLPPLYWAADGRTPFVAGVPLALFYFLAVGVCIVASLVFAYASGAEGMR